jgi:hypothetical protein
VGGQDPWDTYPTTLNGTPGNDVFAFSTDGTNHTVHVTLAGQPMKTYVYPVSLNPLNFVFNGGGGSDQITIDGGPANEKVVTHAKSVTFTGPSGTHTVAGNDIADIRVTAGAGTTQPATMYDAAGATDTFTSQPAYGDMTGTGHYEKLAGFSYINAYSSGDANDTARFYDSPGADVYTASPGLSSMTGPGYATNYARGFPLQYGNASFVFGTPRPAAEQDRANVYDGPGNDTWVGYGAANYSKLVNSTAYPNFADATQLIQAEGFDLQYGYGGGGGTINYARFWDTAGDDVFNGKGTYSYLTDAAAKGTFWQASNFEWVYAQKSSTGYDRAYFTHFTGTYTGMLNLWSDKSYMYGTDAGKAFYNLATNFNEYIGWSLVPSSTDQAYFRTTGGGNDVVVLRPTDADLTGTVSGKPVHLSALGFKGYTVWRNLNDNGTNNRATLYGTSGNDTLSKGSYPSMLEGCLMTLSTGNTYTLGYYPSGTGVVKRGLDRVQVNLAGGNDRVTLTGATTGNSFSGTNHFWGCLTDAVLSDGTLDPSTGNLLAPSAYYYKISGLDTLADRVTAQGGTIPTAQNKKHVINPIDYALTFEATWLEE